MASFKSYGALLAALTLTACGACYSDSDQRCYTEEIFGAESSRLAGSQVDFVGRRAYDKLPVSAGIRIRNLPYGKLASIAPVSTIVPVPDRFRDFVRSIRVDYGKSTASGQRFLSVQFVRGQGDAINVRVPVEVIISRSHTRYDIRRPKSWKGWYPGRACAGYFTDNGTQFTLIGVDDLSPQGIYVPAERLRLGAPPEDACE